MKRAFLIPTILMLAGCSSGPAATPGSPRIRVENATDVTLDVITVVFPDQTEQYGALPPGRASSYRAIDRAYRYAYVKVEFGAEESVLQPIDYVGESLLPPGRYTYRLTWGPDPSPRELQLELVID